MKLRAGPYEFAFPGRALIMGILNITPDSFSDGGLYFEVQAAEDRASRLLEEGADILDIGGESTRPGAQAVAEAEELRRVLPVIERLAGRITIPISIDTRKPRVAEAALAAGATLINDVGANRTDPTMWEVAADRKAGYVAMHMQGSPETMQKRPEYTDVVAEVAAFFRDRLERLRAAGVASDQVIFDVGIGFGKGLTHNLELLKGMKHFTTLGRPLLLGASRKSFIGGVLSASPGERMPGGLACACWAVQAGAQIIRTHDVRETKQAVRMIEAIISAHE